MPHMAAFYQAIFGKIPFLVARYWPSSDGTLTPDRPGHCPFGLLEACRIKIKNRRSRKCGPPFPLVQFFCKFHSVSFTVYPPGWVPFGRRPWLALAEDGTETCYWEKTYFIGILHMCGGDRWPEESSTSPGVRRTQGRHINALSELFSLHAADQEIQHQTAECLGVEVMKIQDFAHRIREGPSLTLKAMGVRAILECFKPRLKATINSILQLGHKRSFWGPPLTENCG